MPEASKGKQPLRYVSPDDPSPNLEQTGRPATVIDVTEGLRSLLLESDASRPKSLVAPPNVPTRYKGARKLPRRRSGGAVPTRTRPRLRRKAETAPPGTINFLFAKPHPPRRAISARIGESYGTRNSTNRRSGMTSPLLPRMSQLGTPESRSLISRRKSTIKSPQKQKKFVWKAVPPQTRSRYETVAQALENRTGTTSFSEKLRVRETLKQKKVRYLDTKVVDFMKRDLPDTPGSLVSTPRELYGKASPGPRSHALKRRSALQPTSANTPRHSPMRLEPIIQARIVNERLSSQLKDYDLWRRRVYIPGPIRPAGMSGAAYRANTVATLEPFTAAVEGNSPTRRASDDSALDELTSYFESLGIVPHSAEDELDRYWEPVQERRIRQALPKLSPKAKKTLGIDDTVDIIPQRPASMVRSATSPQLNPNPRHREKFRRLFGLPR